MGRLRSQAIVVEGDRILLVKTHFGNRDDYELPGGGIENSTNFNLRLGNINSNLARMLFI